MSWVRIINIPRILQNKDTYLHLAAKTGQSEMFEIISAQETVKNPRGNEGKTPFHLACQFGHFKIAKIVMQKFDVKIEFQRKLAQLKFSHYCAQFLLICVLLYITDMK